MTDIHSCSYYCGRPACIKRQRDELRDKIFGEEMGIDRGARDDVPNATTRADDLRGGEPDLLNQTCCECGKSGGYALYCLDCWGKASKWVGLTGNEIVTLCMEFTGQFHPADFARAIEHKLREKNHWNG